MTPSRAKHTEVFRERRGSSAPGTGRDGAAAERRRGPGAGPEERPGRGAWTSALLSALGSAVAVAAVGGVCALFYPVLKELRADRLRRHDGTEERMLGFWSIFVLSALAGCVCCSLSCVLTYLHSYRPDGASPTTATEVSRHEHYVSYGVALLNGVTATLTVVWSLS